jgi:hypothetical protein
MTSFRQIEANRRNATKSTGPITQEGKQRSRCNAVRHGLTAETVIGALEDSEDYTAFEAAIVADYDAQTTVERELVLRLASLLWRLRRATTTETGLFEIEANHRGNFRQARQIRPASPEIVYAMLEPAAPVSFDRDPASHDTTNATKTGQKFRRKSVEAAVHPAVDLARCFLRLANLPNYALDRLSRYEATLWRQVRQVLLALDALDRCKPHERRRRPFISNRQGPPACERGEF